MLLDNEVDIVGMRHSHPADTQQWPCPKCNGEPAKNRPCCLEGIA